MSDENLRRQELRDRRDKSFKLLGQMHQSQIQATADIGEIKEKVNCLPCEVHSLKIKMLQRIVYGAVGLVLIAFMVELLDRRANAQQTSKTQVSLEAIIAGSGAPSDGPLAGCEDFLPQKTHSLKSLAP